MGLVDTVNMTACSGTVFKTDPASGVGWMITAAHCVKADPTSNPPLPQSVPANMFVIEGTDYNSTSSVAYQVLDFTFDPDANPPDHDWAVIQFGGVTDKVPTIPLLTADLDDLENGSAIEEIGYGQTANNTSNDNSIPLRIHRRPRTSHRLFGCRDLHLGNEHQGRVA